MVVTAYCPCRRCCGIWSKTDAQGRYVNVTASGVVLWQAPPHFVAAPPEIPFGALVRVAGYGDAPVPVLDRGGAIRGNRLDVYFSDHQAARNWGRRTLDVQVYVEASNG